MSDIQTNAAGTLILTGELSFATATGLYKKGCHAIATHHNTIFDLHHVTTSDNSGPALLVAWTRYAKILNKSLKFIAPPLQLLSMLKLTDLQKLLPIEGNFEF